MIMKIIAHRGASATCPENTIEAFAAALKMDANAIETDIRKCPHCRKLKLSHEPIQSENECKKLTDFASMLGFGQSMELVLELKEEGLYEDILRASENCSWPEKITISSFLWMELWCLRRSSRNVRIGILCDDTAGIIQKSLLLLVVKLIGAGSIHLDFAMIKKENGLAAYFKSKNIEVWGYAVNSEEDIRLAKKLNLDAIFTDYPAYASYIIFGNSGDL